MVHDVLNLTWAFEVHDVLSFSNYQDPVQYKESNGTPEPVTAPGPISRDVQFRGE